MNFDRSCAFSATECGWVWLYLLLPPSTTLYNTALCSQPCLRVQYLCNKYRKSGPSLIIWTAMVYFRSLRYTGTCYITHLNCTFLTRISTKNIFEMSISCLLHNSIRTSVISLTILQFKRTIWIPSYQLWLFLFIHFYDHLSKNCDANHSVRSNLLIYSLYFIFMRLKEYLKRVTSHKNKVYIGDGYHAPEPYWRTTKRSSLGIWLRWPNNI